MVMRQELMQMIAANSDYHQFIQENPSWYRRLTRNPTDMDIFDRSVKQYFKKTIPDQVGKWTHNVQVASMMWDLLQMMQSSD